MWPASITAPRCAASDSEPTENVASASRVDSPESSNANSDVRRSSRGAGSIRRIDVAPYHQTAKANAVSITSGGDAATRSVRPRRNQAKRSVHSRTRESKPVSRSYPRWTESRSEWRSSELIENAGKENGGLRRLESPNGRQCYRKEKHCIRSPESARPAIGDQCTAARPRASQRTGRLRGLGVSEDWASQRTGRVRGLGVSEELTSVVAPCRRSERARLGGTVQRGQELVNFDQPGLGSGRADG